MGTGEWEKFPGVSWHLYKRVQDWNDCNLGRDILVISIREMGKAAAQAGE